MPCIVFILDTSGSMSSQTYTGFSIFDTAKNYIDTFIRSRSRDASRGSYDRYMLITTSERYPNNIKASGKEGTPQLSDQIRRILPYGTSFVHLSLLDAFKFVHVTRSQTAIDTYGWGRMPQNSEQVMFILLTDGAGISTIPKDFKLEFDQPYLGSELIKEAYRWDQKLYTCVFRLPSTPMKISPVQQAHIDIDIDSIQKLCVQTGGRSFSILSHKQIVPSIEFLSATLQQHTVAVRFDFIMSNRDQSEEMNRLRNKIRKASEIRPVTHLALRSLGGRPVTCHWPIPEAFWPTKNMDQLPPRDAHPIILVATEAIPSVFNNDILYPFDKIEVEPSFITEYATELLQGRKDYCVQVFVANSSSLPGNGYPFGCLKISNNVGGINLFILPFNYPVLSALLEEVKNNGQDNGITQSPTWRAKLDNYLVTVPLYMSNATKKALAKFKLKGGAMDEQVSMSTSYSPSLIAYLSRLKNQGKEECDRVATMCTMLIQREASKPPEPMVRVERITSRCGLVGVARFGDDRDDREEYDPAIVPVNFSKTFSDTIALCSSRIQPPALDSLYRNPLTATTTTMISALTRMQANAELIYDTSHVMKLDNAKPGLRARFHHLEELHNLPIASMGNYDEYIKGKVELGMTPLRDLEPPVRISQAFGNPYKVKSLGAGIDEVMDSQAEAPARREKRFGDSSIGAPPKRRRGPLNSDAFTRWRERQSEMGSQTGSVISVESISFDDALPSTSNGSVNKLKYINETGLEDEKEEEEDEKINELVDKMDTVEAVTFEVNNVVPPLPAVQINGKINPPVVSVRHLSGEEILQKKMAIGSIVRRPANARAFEEIVKLLVGTAADCGILLRFAIREAQRYKYKSLTDKLERRLNEVTL